MSLRQNAVVPITTRRATYGWYLVDAKGQAAENITERGSLPFYKTEKNALRAAEKALLGLMKPATRTTDPATSHAAEASVNEGSRANQVYRLVQAIRENPGCTGNELARVCPLNERQISRRLNDAAGMIKPGIVRECDVTGRKARTWWATI